MAAERLTCRIMGNPIVTDTYTSDPAALVHDGTVYVYTGHDEAPPGVEEYRRFVCVDRLTYDDDGRINRVHMTTEGLRSPLASGYRAPVGIRFGPAR